MLVLPSIAEVSEKIAATLENGLSAALVGPPGVGATSIAVMACGRLESTQFLYGRIDCRETQTWQEQMRAIEGSWVRDETRLARILVIDHAGDLDPRDVGSLVQLSERTHSMLWVGNLDIRALHANGIPRMHTIPRTHFMVPDLAPDDLIQVYRAIATTCECDWGEALIYFLLDWCGDDLALVVSASKYFYGNWQTNLQDGTVADCLGRWLAEDDLVESYRQNLRNLPDPCKAQLRLLGIGGKLPCVRREIDQETDQYVRRAYLRGALAPNLLPGYYRFRNLTIRHLWGEIEGFGRSLSPEALLRGSANARVNQLLQDIEWSLRQLLAKVLQNLGTDECRTRLLNVRVVERGITPEFSRRILRVAQARGGMTLMDAVNKVLVECRREAEEEENLWAKICLLYRGELRIADERAEPPLSEVPAFMTLREMSDVLLRWKADVFLQSPVQGEGLPAPDRWKEYLARIQRLRNQTAHLRNVGFQDLADLLANARAVRNDFRSSIKVLDQPVTDVSEIAR
jgi:hypothetical protein